MRKKFLMTLVLLTLPGMASAAAPQLDPECALRLLDSAEGDMTLAEVRERCAATGQESATGMPAQTGPVERRLDADREAIEHPFTIMAHKPNYFLAAAYNFEGWAPEPYRAHFDDPDYQNKKVEGQFQISLKVPLALGLYHDKLDLYAAYTNRSFWQMYNSEESEPFRETNHEPELWVQLRNDWRLWGFTNSLNAVGWVHQSNGRGGDLSRSWNRIFANLIFERGSWAVSFKPWIWVSRDRAASDNPDIDDFMGHGELRLAYGRKGHVFGAMMRNQIESGFDEGAVELSWSFPMFDYSFLRGYVQYFYGYGESLIDYNHKVNRLGVGISVTDWFD